MEKLRSQLSSLENGITEKHAQALTEIQRENKYLESELSKARQGIPWIRLSSLNGRTELDRAKDTDGLIPHYRVAIMKVKGQVTALKEKIDILHSEKLGMRQEIVQILSFSTESHSKNRSSSRMLYNNRRLRPNRWLCM
jgi:hypothetical protein